MILFDHILCLFFQRIDAHLEFCSLFPKSMRARQWKETEQSVIEQRFNFTCFKHDQTQSRHHDPQWPWPGGERTKERHILPHVMQEKISKKSPEGKTINVWKPQGESERQRKASHAQLKFRPRRTEESAPYFPRWRQADKNRDLTIRAQLYLGTDGNAQNYRALGTLTGFGD